MKLTIDFESRSACDLRKTGCWPYAEHPTTQIMCLALKRDNHLPELWVPPFIRQKISLPHFYNSIHFDFLEDDAKINQYLEDAEIIEAHNVEFEVSLWTRIMHGRYGFTTLFEDRMLEKLRCSASVCSYKALPRALGKAGFVLGLQTQKDNEGHKLMMKMCKPRVPRKAEKEDDPDWEANLYYWEEPDQILRLAEYCAGDVDAEFALSSTVGDLPPAELDVWRLDQLANYTGVCVDLPLAHKMRAIRDDYLATVKEEFATITGGQKPSQVKQLNEWVATQGWPLPQVDAPTIAETVQDPNIPANVKRALEIRALSAKTSLSKLDSAINCTCDDGRMRGNLMYSGAATHRWSGKNMQLHNIPSRGLIDGINQLRAAIMNGLDAGTLALIYENPQLALSSVLRNVVLASPGMSLFAADFASIEGRVLAWLAGETHIVEGYYEGLDMYKIAAQTVFNVGYDDVTKDQRRVGKIPELAGGYGGGWRAYMKFAVKEGMKPSQEIFDSLTDADFTDWKGQALTHVEAGHQKWWDPIVMAWRANRPATTGLWRALEDSAVMALQSPGQPIKCGRLMFGYSKDWLRIRLPGGNVLYYRNARLHEEGGRKKITYYGTDSMKGGAWVKKHTYGGKLVENVVQSIARDMMAEALVRMVNADTGLRFLFSVHDELVFEGPEDAISLEDYCALMSVNPDWAQDCPIEADGFIAKEYRK